MRDPHSLRVGPASKGEDQSFVENVPSKKMDYFHGPHVAGVSRSGRSLCLVSLEISTKFLGSSTSSLVKMSKLYNPFKRNPGTDAFETTSPQKTNPAFGKAISNDSLQVFWALTLKLLFLAVRFFTIGELNPWEQVPRTRRASKNAEADHRSMASHWEGRLGE